MAKASAKVAPVLDVCKSWVVSQLLVNGEREETVGADNVKLKVEVVRRAAPGDGDSRIGATKNCDETPPQVRLFFPGQLLIEEQHDGETTTQCSSRLAEDLTMKCSPDTVLHSFKLRKPQFLGFSRQGDKELRMEVTGCGSARGGSAVATAADDVDAHGDSSSERTELLIGLPSKWSANDLERLLSELLSDDPVP